MIGLKYNIKSALFALILTLGTYLLIFIQSTNSEFTYVIALFVNLIIFSLELSSVKITSRAKLIQMGLPEVNRYTRLEELVLHQFLPLIMFTSFNLFVFFNSVELLNYIILLFVFIGFYILFINIRAYFEDKYKLEQGTHFVYAFAAFFGMFTVANVILNAANIYDLMPFIVILIFFICSLGINFALLIDLFKINLNFIITIVVTSIIVTIIALLLYYQTGTIIQASFLATAAFYFVSALIQHKQDATLNIAVIYEYTVIFVLAYVLLYGIS